MYEDTFDLRDLAEEVDPDMDNDRWIYIHRLAAQLGDVPEDTAGPVPEETLDAVRSVLVERGDNGDPTLIADSYFQEYAQELADDIGAIPDDLTWPLTCIDWEHAARELKYDYTAVDFEGTTYWTRAY